MLLSQGQIIADRYEIIKKIGQGGMSIVYLVRDKRLGRYVTLKVLKEEHMADEEFVLRFNTEAGAVASLSHPNIVNVYDVGNDGDINYIVMEYIEGETLKDLIDKKAPFKPGVTLCVAIEIAEALSHAHKNGIIHRDIKPQNVLVTSNGGIKVMDFGIARTVNSDTIAMGGSTLGSVHYFSPEQARGNVVNYQSDLYSLGIVMYEMATGNLPFDADETVSIALMHINNPIPNIRDSNYNTPDSLINIVSKLTFKDLDMRYESADLLITDLKRVIVDPDTVIDYGANNQLVRLNNKNNKNKPDSNPIDIDRNFDLEAELANEHYEEGGRPRKNEALIVVAALLSAFVIIAISMYFLLPVLQNRMSTVASELINVPGFEGMLFDEASVLAEELGLTIGILREDFDDSAPGTILKQNRDADGLVSEGTEIGVIVSKGKELYEVPDFTDKDERDAYDIIGDLPLELKIQYEFSDDAPHYTVISQDPEKGAMVGNGTEITLTVSKGLELRTVTMPDLSSYYEDGAKALLQSIGLVVAPINYEAHSSYARGRIISQYPAAGDSVLEGSIVTLTVCSGAAVTPSPSPVPTPTPTAVSEVTKVLTIRYSMPSDKSEVTVSMKKVTAEGIIEIYNKVHTADDFPLDMPVRGLGVAEFIAYIDGIELDSLTVVFSTE